MENNVDRQIQWLLQEKYDGKLTAAAKQDIEKLKAGVPLDYLIGFMEFLGCKILANKDALIPRVETEYWVGEVMDKDLRCKMYDVRILDMFSGSGAIGLAILKHMKNTYVVFADSEKNCLQQIRANLAANKIPKKRFKIIQSDIFSNLKSYIVNHKSFDCIFANPPYIPTKKTHNVQASVLHYEPHTALFGGGDGLLYIGKFLSRARHFLRPGGTLFMEFDSPQKNAIAVLLKKHGYSSWKFHKDQFGRWRWVAVDN